MDIQKDTRAENLLDTEAVILLDDLKDIHLDIAEDIPLENVMDIQEDTRPEDLLDIVADIPPANDIDQEKLAVITDIHIVMLGKFSNWFDFTFK